MRIKSLLCLAAFAAGVVTCMAQGNVYSLNVVGYHTVKIPPNSLGLIANQLNTTNNTLGALIPVAPDGAQFYKYSGTYTTYTYDETVPGWLPDGNATLNPGEGGFFRNNTASELSLTFVGEVMQGTALTINVPTGLSIRSSMVPQEATLPAMNYPGKDGDQVYTYSGTYTTYTYDETVPGWLPNDPTLKVGQAFFARKGAGENWVRNFTVPQ